MESHKKCGYDSEEEFLQLLGKEKKSTQTPASRSTTIPKPKPVAATSTPKPIPASASTSSPTPSPIICTTTLSPKPKSTCTIGTNTLTVTPATKCSKMVSTDWCMENMKDEYTQTDKKQYKNVSCNTISSNQKSNKLVGTDENQVGVGTTTKHSVHLTNIGIQTEPYASSHSPSSSRNCNCKCNCSRTRSASTLRVQPVGSAATTVASASNNNGNRLVKKRKRNRSQSQSPDPELREGIEHQLQNGHEEEDNALPAPISTVYEILPACEEGLNPTFAQIDLRMDEYRLLRNAQLQSETVCFTPSEMKKQVATLSPRYGSWEEMYQSVYTCAFKSNICGPGSEFTLGYITVESRSIWPFEETTNDGPFIFTCIKGSIVFKTSQLMIENGVAYLQPIHLSTGDIIMLERGTPYSIENRTSKVAKLLYYVFNGGAMESSKSSVEEDNIILQPNRL